MHKNVLFRGCTRPAMFMGVPYIPFFIGAGGSLLMGFYFGLQYLLLMPIVIYVMRQMARRDEMIFRLLGLNLQFKLRARNVKEHGGMWVFSPNAYRLSRPGAKRRLSGPFIISGKMTGPAKAAGRGKARA
ncbi:MAG: VirB3 family type IV secretion system protein [Xanthomonadales bacterium]|nr:VirB3 family type IV secretion system protein [Xanthomonadales bacterium]